ncbi:MAG: glucose-6-phosphate dehydrogenase, partial [Deltaproteobacteria bacterium]|nr:glucose-6-phosphate dehydrogenase [Deltaproteobacteria bacterium]
MATTHTACDFTIYGVLGDLSRRKLIPSLYQLDKADLLHPDTRVLGVARHDLSQEEFAGKIRESLETFVKEPLDPEIVGRLMSRLVYVLVNLDKPEDFKRLAENTDQSKRILVNYFS